jgi:hypothetical protein
VETRSARLYEETGEQDKAVVAAYRKAVAKAPYELDTQRRLIGLLENVRQASVEALQASYETVASRSRPARPGSSSSWPSGTGAALDGKAKALETLRPSDSRQRFPTDAGILTAAGRPVPAGGARRTWRSPSFERLARHRARRSRSHLVTLGAQYFQRGETDQARWRPGSRIGQRQDARGLRPARRGAGRTRSCRADGLHQLRQGDQGSSPRTPTLYRGRAQMFESTKRSHADAVGDWEKVLSLLTPADRSVGQAQGGTAQSHGSTSSGAGARGSHREPYLQPLDRGVRRQSPPDVEAGYFLVEYYGRRSAEGSSRSPRSSALQAAWRLTDQEVLLDLVKALRAERTTGLRSTRSRCCWRAGQGWRRRASARCTRLIAEIKTDARSGHRRPSTWAQKALEPRAPRTRSAYERLAERYVEMQQLRPTPSPPTQKVLELDAAQLQRVLRAGRAARAAQVQRRPPRPTCTGKILRNATDEADRRAGPGKRGDRSRRAEPTPSASWRRSSWRRCPSMMSHKPGLSPACWSTCTCVTSHTWSSARAMAASEVQGPRSGRELEPAGRAAA